MEKADQIAKRIINSKKVSVLTGAGISTESGIPDFRSPKGIWHKFSPELLSRQTLENNPDKFYREGLNLLKEINGVKNKKPNRAHYLLAELERQGKVSTIITQNIDGLHQQAGSRKVLEVHGNLRQAYCMKCSCRYGFDYLMDLIRKKHIPPRCGCGGIIRPEMVLFGDMLGESYRQAEREVAKSNLLLIIGSSLEVSPVSNLVAFCPRFIIINKEATPFDRYAYLAWHTQATAALGRICSQLLEYEDK
ncbi:MAG: Sir2 family NAD-dependent protein deacetylase [Actinomycetia bacterium]|nr:Sir2 family NAD-dependent protein deacetylase [Actinomycetes bacterium]